jgi:type II secretory pathway pseudopilin PulG
MDIDKRNQLLTILLGVIIIGMSYYLYISIVGPYQAVLDEREMVERERHRMEVARDAIVQYNRRKGNYPPTEGGLDSLVAFLKSDSMMVARGEDLFEFQSPSTYDPDSVIYSPRPPHNRFEYTLNDTLRPQLYLLENPGSEDQIGSLERTTMLNAPNWN